MDQTTTLLPGHTDEEKGAYLGAIASIATADHSASEVEVGYLRNLAEAAELSQEQEDAVLLAATELSGDELTRCLDILKTSDLKYSLVTDLISFAESDKEYSASEKANIEKIAAYLDIDKQQFSLLDQFVKKTAETGQTGEAVTNPGFLSSLGLEEKFKSAGLNMGSIVKGLIAIGGPLLLGKLLSRRRGGSNVGQGGGSMGSNNPLDSLLGGGGGGLGGLLGGNGGNSGGLGSIIGMLNGGRGFGGIGGLLGKILGR
ncbi:MAG: TerB family tellurite resistance protein [Chitinophagaceae bacterium]